MRTQRQRWRAVKQYRQRDPYSVLPTFKRPTRLKIVAGASEGLRSAPPIAHAYSAADPEDDEEHDDEVDEERGDHAKDVGDG